MEKGKLMRNQTVIVIGAGIAGLTAAEKLGAKGYKVIILEARQSIGGRVRISHDIPLGPLYLHEVGRYQGKGGIEGYIKSHPDYLLTTDDLPSFQPIPSLLEELDIHSAEVWHNDFEQRLRVYGENEKDFDLTKFNTIYHNYRNQRDNYHPNFSTNVPSSIEERFAKALVTIFAEAYSGISFEELQIIMQNATENELVFFEYGDMHRLIEGYGYYILLKSIENKLKNTKIYFESLVTKIEMINEKVVIDTLNGGKFVGDAVIATMPLGVLKKDVVQIPNLSSAKRSAIQNLKMGLMNTVTLKFETQFWSNENTSFVLLNTNPNERPITVLLNANKILPTTEPTLVASFFAADGLRDKKILIEEAKSAIKKAWTNSPDPIFEEATAWHLDPYSYGSYASFSIETKDSDIVNIMSPEWGGRFVFAGDAIVPIGLMGCFHGAYISALRAARLIDEYLSS